MSIASRIEAIEQHLTDDYSVLEVAGADLTNVDKNILNLKPTWQERLLYFMNNGTDVVWNNWEKVTGEGETLTLNSTEEAPMKINLKGNTTQNGTPTPEAPQDIHVVSGDNTIKVEGKNLLPTNASYWESGHYDTSGAKTWFDTRMRVKKLVPISPSTTYYVSNALNKRLIIREYNANKEFIYNTGAIDSGNTFTTQSNTYYLGISIEITYSEYDETTSQLFMCNNNVVDKTYEPYQSQSYPINLGVENLLQNNLTSGTNNGITYVVNEDKSVTLNGTATAITWLILNSSVTLEAGTYTMTSGYSGNDVRVYSTGLGVYTLDGQRTVTKTSSVSGDVAINIPSGTICNNLTIKPMIEKGTKANSYTPYGTTPIELCKIGDYQDSIKKSTGKNLFDKDNANVLNGMFINAVAGNIGSNANATSIYIPINPNTTYCVSKTKGNRFAIGYSSTTPAVNVSLTNIVDDRTKTSLTSTSASDSKYLVIYISLSDTETYENIISTIQIEYGNTPTDFEPYGKVWYLNKQIGKVVLNGSESWTRYGAFGSAYLFYVNNITDGKTIVGSRNIGFGLSNYFTWASTSSNAEIPPYIRFQINNGKRFYIGFENDMTLNNFQTWLSTHNTIVYYVLANPTYTEITDSTLLSQLEALNGAKSYTTQTNISQENNDLPFILDVTALKQLTQ